MDREPTGRFDQRRRRLTELGKVPSMIDLRGYEPRLGLTIDQMQDMLSYLDAREH